MRCRQCVGAEACELLPRLPWMIATCFRSLTLLSGQTHTRQECAIPAGEAEDGSVEAAIR